MTPRAGYTPAGPKRTSIDSIAEGDHLARVFAGASESARRQIAESISAYVYDTSRVYNDVRDDRKIRVTDDAADVKNTAGGTQVKYPGESYFDWMNFVGGSLDVESTLIGRRVNIRMGAGADCLFDQLVSKCWADEVAAGRGTEGQTFTSLTGCTFKVGSTVTGAITQCNTDNLERPQTIFVCRGDYVETLPNPTCDLRIVGAGRNGSEDEAVTSIGGATSASPTITCTTTSGISPRTEWEDLRLVSATAGSAINHTALCNAYFRNCTIHVKSGQVGIHTDGSTAGCDLWAVDCDFTTDGGESTGVFGEIANSFVRMSHCKFNGFGAYAIRCHSRAQLDNITIAVPANAVGLLIDGHVEHWQTDNIFIDGNFNTGSVGIQSDFAEAGGPVTLRGISLLDLELGIDFSNTNDLRGDIILTNITGKNVTTGVNWGASAWSGTVTMINCHGLSHTGTGPRSKRVMLSRNADGAHTDNVLGNGVLGVLSIQGFSRTLSWGQFFTEWGGIRVSTAAGSHTYALFDGNTYYVSVNSAGTVTPTNTGSFAANEMPLAVVVMNNNRIESIDWYDAFLKSATATGAAAAPTPHAFVGTHHSGDDDHTLSPGVLSQTVGDANFIFSLVSGNPRWTAASGDYIEFNRGGDSWQFGIGGNAWFQFTTTEMVTAMPHILAQSSMTLHGALGFIDVSLTIAAGAINPNSGGLFRSRVLVDTEAAAASDDLDTITAPGNPAGAILFLSPASGARTVVVKHGTGNILCVNNADITLDDVHDFSLLIYDDAQEKYFAAPLFGTGGGGTITVEEGNVSVATDITNLDFGAGFDITAAGGEAEIALDLSEIAVTRSFRLMARSGTPAGTGGCDHPTFAQDSWSLAFGPSNIEHAIFEVQMPGNWDGGTFTAKFCWRTASITTTHDVRWGIKGVAIGDNEAAITAAYGTAQEVTDTVATATAEFVYISAATPAITLAGTPAAGDYVRLDVYRDATHAADDLNVDAKLIWVELRYTATAGSE